MRSQSTFPLHDRALDGQLRTIIETWRAEGISYADIAYRLRDEHQVFVNGTTVMRWCREQGITS